MISPIQHFELLDAKMDYYEQFLDPIQSSKLFKELESELHWQQDQIKMFGKSYQVPRLQAWYADPGKSYSYSGISLKIRDWHSSLEKLRLLIEEKSGYTFNSVLANLYRNGMDSNGWHADNEKELGKNPIIASISLGTERYFHIKHRTKKEKKHKLLLKNGSLLIMHGAMQHHWLHQIAKTKKNIGPRINLTFRYIMS